MPKQHTTKKGASGAPCDRFVINLLDQSAADAVTVIVPWIGIESSLGLVCIPGGYPATSEPRAITVTIDDLVRAKLWERKEGAEEVKHVSWSLGWKGT